MRSALIKFIGLLLLILLPLLGVRADILVIDAPNDVGWYTSLAVVNGNPAISYYDNTPGDLMYVRATDASGTTWGTPVSVDTGGVVGLYTSLAVVNGNPAISYWNTTTGNLMYVRATDASGTAWDTPVSVDTSLFIVQQTSLAVVNGNPAISYYDGLNTDLMYVQATNPTGTIWGTPVSVDMGGSVGRYASLVIVNGNPAIGYYDTTNGDLKYVRATDADGTVWGTPVSVDTTGDVGQYTSLVIVNGNPAISYYDTSNGHLKYIRAIDASGSAWGAPLSVDTVGSVGAYTSLTMVNGNPAISYFDITNSNLKYIRATDASGTTWGTPVSVDTMGSAGLFTSLAVVNGNPAISYYSNTDLKFARACDANGTSWLVSCTPTITLEFASATSNAAEAAGFGNLLRVTTNDTNPTTAAVTITVSVTGGTATAADYALTGTITIPAGTAHNALVSIASGITVTDETLVESNETVALQLSAPSGALLGTQTTTTHTINNDDTATVSVVANDPGAAENPTDNGQFTITMSAANGTGSGITVNYTVTGTATPGTDYSTLSGSVVIPNGSSSVTVDVLMAGFNDALADAAETVIVTLNTTSNPSVTIGTPNNATVTIADDETAGYIITPLTPTTLTEPSGSATFSIRLATLPTGTVTLDFTSLDLSECFPSPPTSLTFDTTNWNVAFVITFNVTDDVLPDGTQFCPISIARNASSTAAEYNALPNPPNLTLTVLDNEPPLVPPASGGSTNTPTAANSAAPQISVFDPAISKLGFLLPGQLGAKGEQLEWVVTVSNVGGAAGNNVVVTDILRPELNIDRVNAPDGTVNISGQTVSVTFATIQPGQTFQFSIFTTVTKGVTVDNTACVQAAGIATECTTAPAVSSLPSTGETPSWATLLRGLVVVILVSSGWWVLSRQAMPKSTDP